MESRNARVDVGSAELSCLIDGPEDGPLALLVHGFPDGPHSFRHQVAPLVARGFRVVRPWTRGYAPSSLARDGRYDVERLGDDLLALADHFSPTRPILLVGHDWGAIAAQAACARSPGRIERLCTVAVPHLRVAGPRWLRPSQLRKSWYVALFQMRLVAERRVAARDFQLIDRLWRDWSPSYHASPDELTQVKDGFRNPAHLRAVLAYYRSIFSSRAKLLRRKTVVPALYVHGEEDGCVGVALCAGVEAAYTAGVRICLVRGAGHFAHLEQPEIVNQALQELLAGSSVQ